MNQPDYMTNNPAKVTDLCGGVRLYEDMPESDCVIRAGYMFLSDTFYKVIGLGKVMEIRDVGDESGELILDL
jgi:hypothetical protein